ncbi:hypothetical protein [Variovorax terrae]|uniref:Uncharacterized protein n=1 Tax=Variovorax terrae TaxID=2923278 RepID=A0A9X1VSP8_9BURK|nr:hypothetical protein [Variovorax terrae]MCJ0762642.1 hypothetical protein [Variovorax terrae]
MDIDDTDGGAALPQGRFSGREEFRQRVRDALACAAREGWREIIVSDATFEDWPLGERAVAQALQDWCVAGRRFIMLAQRYDEVVRQQARFVTWRQTWSHLITCWRCASADALELPSALWSPGWVMQRLDPVRSIGVSGREPERRVLLRESLDEWLREATPGFPSTTLGL